MNGGIQKIREGKELTLEEKNFFEKKLQKFNFDQFIFFLAVWHGYADISRSDGTPQKFSFRGKPQYPIERMNHLLRIKDVQVWPIQFEGEFSIKNQVQKVKNLCESVSKGEGDQREYVLDQERCGIARIFGLDTGGGMKPYRQAFVRELLFLPQEEGEKLWGIVNDSVRIRERANAIPELWKSSFPQRSKRQLGITGYKSDYYQSYCAITRFIRSRITSNRAPILRSPVKILGKKLFMIMSCRPRQSEHEALSSTLSRGFLYCRGTSRFSFYG